MPSALRSTGSRRRALAAIAIVAGTLAVQDAAAQTCFRGRPKPTCRSFFLTEADAGLMLTLGSRAGGANGTATRLGVSVGWMRNVGGRSAVGATLAGGAYVNGGNSAFVSFRPRYRYWLSRTASLDVGPGVQWTPGRVERIEARAGLTYRDLFGAWTEMDLDWGSASRVDWLFGVKTGGQAGIVSYIAGAITLGILAIAFASIAD
jgi:hypothetical protein